MMKLGVIGLGVMGTAMARHLIAAGHEVMGFDIDREPLLDAALGVYEESSRAGLGDLDAAALCRYLEQIGGLSR